MANPASFTITELPVNTATARPAVQTVDTDTTTGIPCDPKSQMDRLFFEFFNAAAQAITITFLAGDNPPSHLTRPLTVELTATGGATPSRIVGPFESQRFVRADGTIRIAFVAASGSPNVQVRAYRLQKI